MIQEKYKGTISIVSIGLCLILILSAFFMAPKKAASKTAAENKKQVLNKDKVTEINIEVKESDWKWLIENATKEEFRSATITINGETFYNVGLRPKGNSSLTSVDSNPNSDRFSFKIDFGQFIEGQTYHGFEKLALNNMMSDTTYMKEYLSYGLYDSLGVPTPQFSYGNIKINGKDWGLYLAVEVIEKNFLQNEFGSSEGNLYKPESMEIGAGGANKGMGFQGAANQNGKGFPDAGNGGGNVAGGSKEGANGIAGGDDPGAGGKGGASQNQSKGAGAQRGMNPGQGMNIPAQGGNMPFGSSSGGANLKYTDDKLSSYSVIREGAVFKTTSDKDFRKVIAMTKNLKDGTNLEEYLDVENILKYFAVNTFLVNLDSYSGGMYHNYYLYEKDGRFKIFPWDLNMSFAGFSMGLGGENGSQKAINFPIDTPVTSNLEDAPLIGNLLKVDKYKELYHSYLRKITDEYVNSGVFEGLVNKTDKLIDEYVKADATAFYSYDEYKKSLPELISFGKDRAVSVSAQLSGKQPSTTYGNVETKVNLTSLGSMDMGGQKGGFGGQNQANGGRMPGPGGQNQENPGQMPGPGGGQGMGNMPPMENMMEIFNIIRGADIDNLTAQQKEKLKALGVDDAMMDTFKNMPKGGMPGMPNMPGSGAAGLGNMMNLAVQGVVIVVVLLAGLIFVFRFKRKRYYRIKNL